MPVRTLSSTLRFYQRTQQLSLLMLRAARRAGPQGARAVARETAKYQLAAATLAAAAVVAQLDEQGIDAPALARVDPQALAGVTSAGSALLDYLEAAKSADEMSLMAVEQVRDAGRIASGIEIVARPNLAGYVRYLNPPSCGRCTILAGRFYRYSKGFLRHPQCDCVMLPTNVAPSADLITDPMDAFERGLIQHRRKQSDGSYKLVNDLSVAETRAINDGADIGKVVNVQRAGAGLVVAGRVINRGKRLTPEGIYHLAGDDRDEIMRLLKKNKYII